MLNFLSIEGGEGSGKSTVISYIQSFLENKGYNVIVTREPGGVESAEKIREVLLNNEFSKESEMLLFGVCRKEHLDNKIKPNLIGNTIVICDRYVDSSLVYQGLVGGVGIEKVWEFNKEIIGNYIPEKTFYLDVDSEIGLSRVFNNDREQNLYDKRDLSFHKQVREGYLSLIGSDYDNNRIIKIDANQSLEDVKIDLFDKLTVLFGGD